MPKQVKSGSPAINTKFRANLKADQLKKLISLKEDAQPWKAILKATGLSHSKAELAWMEHEAFGQSNFTKAELTPAFVAYARNDLRIGWGPIMVWTQSSEGKVRKAWEAATNSHSEATRIGRGGRFKFDDAELYVGELKPTGTTVPAEAPLTRTVARENALVTRLTGLDIKQVRVIYANYFKKAAPTTATKAKLIIELKKANDERAVQVTLPKEEAKASA